MKDRLRNNQGSKCHYKMYKAGRKWMFCGIMLASLTGAYLMGGNSAEADSINPNASTSTETKPATPSEQTAPNSAVTPDTKKPVTAATPATQTGNQVTIDPSNFQQSFEVHGDAHFESTQPGTVTLTDFTGGQQGSITLNNKINLNQSFDIKGQINLGAVDQHTEGTSGNNGNGGDGLAFGFHDANSDTVGDGGAGLGLGKIPDAIGWKADTTYNWTLTNDALPDPEDFSNGPQTPNRNDYGGGQAFGAFIQSSKNTEIPGDTPGVVSTTGVTSGLDSARAINAPAPSATDKSKSTDPKDWQGEFKDIEINYNPNFGGKVVDGKIVDAKKTLTVTYDNKQWQKDITDWAADKTDTAFFVSAGTAANLNLQQFRLQSFTYEPAATVDVKYVYFNPDAVGPAKVKEIDNYVGEVNYPSGAFVGNKYLTSWQSIPGYRYLRMYPGSLPANGTLSEPGNNGTVTYLYVPDGNGGQHASVQLWDTTDNKPLGYPTSLEGANNSKAYYSDQPIINDYINAGYDYNPQDDSIENGITFDADNSTNPTYRVNLSHGMTHDSETTSRTINYRIKGTTTPVHPSDIQPLAWDIITDKVTGATISVPKGGYEAITAPLVSGYVAETSSVDGQYPGVIIGKYNDNPNITIYYTPNSEKTGIPGNDGSPLVTPPTTPETVTPHNGGGTVVTPPTTTPVGDNGTTPSEPEGDTANNHDKTPNQPSETPSQDNGENVTTDTEKGKAHDAGQMSQVTLAQSSANAQSSVGTVQPTSKNTGLNTASAELPQTNEQRSNTWTILGLSLMSILSLFGITKQKKHEGNN